MMRNSYRSLLLHSFLCLLATHALPGPIAAQQPHPPDAPLPPNVKAVWDLDKAYRDMSPTRERLYLNGLWRFQPARTGADSPPKSSWGFFKVPAFWPGMANYIQEDCQTLHPHPA